MKKQFFLLFCLFTVIRLWAQNDMMHTPLTLEAIESGEIVFENRADGPVCYSLNDDGMQTIESMKDGRIVIQIGDKVSFYGDNKSYAYDKRIPKDSTVNNGNSNDGSEEIQPVCTHIRCTSDCYVYGNIMSLVSSTDYANVTTFNGRFSGLFSGNDHLKNYPIDNEKQSEEGANNRPLKQLLLPATDLTEKYCYSEMFKNCTSLVEPPELPAKTLPEWCYFSMFEGCTSLKKTPELRAKKLVEGCYNYMFCGCSKLSSVYCLATTVPSNSTLKWLEGVASWGGFNTWGKSRSSLKLGREDSSVPEGWILIVEEEPVIED